MRGANVILMVQLLPGARGVDEIQFSATENCISSTPLAPGSSCTIKITFAPRMRGGRSGEIHIDSNFTMVPMVVKLNGSGVSGVARP